MISNVVYVLGAGFSAPLNIPVMSNFIEKAKNLYENDTSKYKHIKQVLDKIRSRLAYVALYYNSNLDNIEEVLSILETERYVGKAPETDLNNYIKFIVDVIRYYTPALNGFSKYERISKGSYKVRRERQQASQPFETESSVINSIFSVKDNSISDVIQTYGMFVIGLFNANIKVKNPQSSDSLQFDEFVINSDIDNTSEIKYSVITLNYDLVLENLAEHISSIISGDEMKFNQSGDGVALQSPSLVKLHGSIENNNIILPTWNKNINKNSKEWEKALWWTLRTGHYFNGS